eukprot:CAMPEP_0205802126 /NCGR_PEP_ID=MMETSP0205-20121125/4349_1 /ASSEMBLY_ACC=CAM_ASM_000278 /TAXON_ID=36767 /ORGANISM="Euplotes focardii, Strain TN1" /LENGTH=79 /DNA_ID=CAMNT_0053068031 /DNA_START=51 /DNA_END=290 /DNA_ORIENTATION=+
MNIMNKVNYEEFEKDFITEGEESESSSVSESETDLEEEFPYLEDFVLASKARNVETGNFYEGKKVPASSRRRGAIMISF